MTECRGGANAKIKRELGWTLRHPSWRQGFAEAYASAAREARQVARQPHDGARRSTIARRADLIARCRPTPYRASSA